MNLRKFFIVTYNALNGLEVVVKCPDYYMALVAFTDYAVRLRGLESVEGWKAHGGTLAVDFDSGGYVRFVAASRHLDGVDIECVVVDEYDVMRGEHEMPLLGETQGERT